jgi:hypothetical protein
VGREGARSAVFREQKNCGDGAAAPRLRSGALYDLPGGSGCGLKPALIFVRIFIVFLLSWNPMSNRHTTASFA